LNKNFLEIGHTGYPMKRNFALISKVCRSLEFGKRENFFTEKLNFAQNRFSEKNSLGTS
jgi:hypothetical protein